MAVQVRVPTILWSYTGGAKVVEGTGDTLGALFVDLDSSFPGLRSRLVSGEGAGDLHRFVNVYVNDEDVRFRGGLDASLADGDSVTILPAVAGGAHPGRAQPGAGWTRRCSAWSGRVRGRAGNAAATALRHLQARCEADGR